MTNPGQNSARNLQNLGGDAGTMLCPDGHRCENYSICAENPLDEGNYYCDCDAKAPAATSDAKYAGLYCEHEATTYCSPTDSRTYHSFCTNHGRCRANVAEYEEHQGCDCEAGYVGSHCQFIEGSEVPNWMGDPSTNRVSPYAQNGSIGAGGIVGVVLLAVAVVVLTALIVTKKISFSIGGDKREEAHSAEIDTNGEFVGGGDGGRPVEAVESPDGKPARGYGMSANLHLDADGGVLKDAMEEKEAAEDDGGMDNEEAKGGGAVEDGDGELVEII